MEVIDQASMDFVGMITTPSFTPAKNGETPEAWWATAKRPLRHVAPCILNISVTTSNTERLHKVYSLVHNDTRNRLNLDRAEFLVMGNVALRMRQVKPQLEFSGYDAFVSTTKEMEQELAEWTELMRAADQATAASVKATDGDGSCKGEARPPTDLEVVEEDGEEAEMHGDAVDDAPPLRRSGRQVVMTTRMRQAQRDLGLGEFAVPDEPLPVVTA